MNIKRIPIGIILIVVGVAVLFITHFTHPFFENTVNFAALACIFAGCFLHIRMSK